MGQSIKEQIEIIKNQRFINKYIQMSDQNLITGYKVESKKSKLQYQEF